MKRYFALLAVLVSCGSMPDDFLARSNQPRLLPPAPPEEALPLPVEDTAETEPEPEIIAEERGEDEADSVEEEIWILYEEPAPEDAGILADGGPSGADDSAAEVEESESEADDGGREEALPEAEPEAARLPEEELPSPPLIAAADTPVSRPPVPSAPRLPPPAPPKIVRPAEQTPVPVPDPETAPAPVLPARPHPAETESREKMNVSRSIRALTGQIIEIPFRGSGWVFLGEQDAKRGLAYDSRRLDDEGQTFVFRAQSPGAYHPQFSKQDFVNNYFIKDIVEVIVANPETGAAFSTRSGENARVSAEPRWPPAYTQASAAAAPQPARTLPAPENPVPDKDSEAAAAEEDAPKNAAETRGKPDYLAAARAGFADRNYSETIAALDRLREENPALTDEVWWLYGQSFESNSAVRDVKSALDAYQHIVRDFPQSKYYENARSRSAYLNKFFFNIR